MGMSYCFTCEQIDQIFKTLYKDYKIYAPKRFENVGRYCNTDVVRYDQVHSVEEIELSSRGDFSPKEVFYPINQTMFHFTQYDCFESKVDDKGILIFVHPCDINGIRRLDTVFLKNGPYEDYYYKRMREKVKFVLLECGEGWDSCFCCSMGTNKTDDYSLAMRINKDQDKVMVEVKDAQFENVFNQGENCEFKPEFVEENKTKVNVPEITNDMLPKIYEAKMWDEYNARCAGCGACNAACITCSCFNTVDTTFTQNPISGERRRTWTGCMANNFTTVNGGHYFRDEKKDRMRFKTLHKVYDYKLRFGKENMCVGCGRCDDICPQQISFAHIINKLNETVAEIKKEENDHE